jgi:N-acyl-D-aspartate/D-glutamate deacylase
MPRSVIPRHFYRPTAHQAVTLLLVAVASACGNEYQLVIEGGRVMDPESGLDSVRNVGIADGRIAAVSEEALEGARVIDGRGLVVAPGFVDLHRHGHDEVGYRLQVQDGVTTGLELEVGTPNVAAWYTDRARGQLVNYGVAIGYLGARATAMGDAVTGIGGARTRDAATPAQIAETERLIRVGLAQGAIGVGFGLAYVPGAGMDEIERMLAVVAQRRVGAFVHTRNGLAGLDSTLTAARNVGASLHVVHANSSGGSAIGPFLGRIERARSDGQDVTTEVYPYAASQTLIESALFDGWESWGDGRFGRYEWVRTGERLTRETFGRYRDRGGSVIIHGRTERSTLLGVTSPLTMVASDGSAGHPRGAGTFAKVLGRYVREQEVLDLMEALSKMTIRPARRLEPFVPAMANKGRIRVGADADITIFDPETVIDRATYADPMRTSEGIQYVLVNGVLVVDEGALVDGARPGRPIRGRATYKDR